MKNTTATLVVLLACLAGGATAQCPLNTTDKEDVDLARYMFELLQNRNSYCESGADFLVNPKAINYSVTSFCSTVVSPNDTVYNVTYSFENCIYNNTQNETTVEFQVDACANATNVLLQPMRLEQFKLENYTNETCPTGFREIQHSDDPDENFTEEWEFRHFVENLYKYQIAQEYNETNLGCNSYVSTVMNYGCIDDVTEQYLGWGTVTQECNDRPVDMQIGIYVQAAWLGRENCSWPEFLPGSPGYDPDFTFTNHSANPAPHGPTGLDAALKCLAGAGVTVVSAADAAALQAASEVWNKLNTTLAAAVAYPADIPQVQAAVACLVGANVPSVPRSGGHSYEGYSVLADAVTIDLKNLSYVNVSADLQTAVVGGGARLGELYYYADLSSKSTKFAVGGTCPPVGVGGLILGGGIGMFAREYGLACDQIVSLQLVDAQGQLITADSSQNQDVLWASCGGGGGNFGIVVEYELKLVDLPSSGITTYSFSVGPKQAPNFMVDLQSNFSARLDPRVSMSLNPGSVGVHVGGSFTGSPAELDAALTAAGMGAKGKYKRVGYATEQTSILNFIITEAYIDSIVTPKDLLNITAMEASRPFFKLKPFYITPDNPLPAAAFKAMMDWVAKAQSSGVAYVSLDILGAKSQVAARASTATAYAHRDAVASVQYGMEWDDADSTAANLELIDEFQQTIAPYLKPNYGTYINYLDIQTPSPQGYYGANLPRLQEIKAALDPNNYFTSPMAILAAGAPPLVTSPGVPVESPAVAPAAVAPAASTPPGPAPSAADAALALPARALLALAVAHLAAGFFA